MVATQTPVQPAISPSTSATMLGEPITVPLVLGLIAVCTGVWVATTEPRAKAA